MTEDGRRKHWKTLVGSRFLEMLTSEMNSLKKKINNTFLEEISCKFGASLIISETSSVNEPTSAASSL